MAERVQEFDKNENDIPDTDWTAISINDEDRDEVRDAVVKASLLEIDRKRTVLQIAEMAFDHALKVDNAKIKQSTVKYLDNKQAIHAFSDCGGILPGRLSTRVLHVNDGENGIEIILGSNDPNSVPAVFGEKGDTYSVRFSVHDGFQIPKCNDGKLIWDSNVAVESVVYYAEPVLQRLRM